jgi:hypothetical protein
MSPRRKAASRWRTAVSGWCESVGVMGRSNEQTQPPNWCCVLIKRSCERRCLSHPTGAGGWIPVAFVLKRDSQFVCFLMGCSIRVSGRSASRSGEGQTSRMTHVTYEACTDCGATQNFNNTADFVAGMAKVEVGARNAIGPEIKQLSTRNLH